MRQIFEATWQFTKVQRALYIEFLRVARMEKNSHNSLLPAVGGNDIDSCDWDEAADANNSFSHNCIPTPSPDITKWRLDFMKNYNIEICI